MVSCVKCEGWLSCKIISLAKNAYPDDTVFPKCRDRCAFLNCHPSSVGLETCRECYGQEIMEAGLTCQKCRRTYKVTKGVVRFVPESFTSPVLNQTQAMFDAQYKNFAVLPKEEWRRHFKSYIDALPDTFIAAMEKTGLDAGCGSGRTISIAAEYCKEIVGFDITSGVDLAYDSNRDKPHVHFIQADIYNLPFKKGYFDFIYSFGVIHHLPEPRKGFNNLLNLLTCSGAIAIYVYRQYEDLWHKLALKFIFLMRLVTTKMHPGVLYVLCLLFSPFIYFVFVLPRKIMEVFRIPGMITSRIPFAQTKNFRYIPAQLFDRFSPPIEYRYKLKEILEWFQDAGLVNIGSSELFGHIVWGSKNQR
jgi:SAM-dependent methyltransferase